MTDCTITKQFGSKPQRKTPMTCWQQASAEEAQKTRLQTGYPIICSYTADWVPAWKWEMFNSLDCFILLQVLLFSFCVFSTVSKLLCITIKWCIHQTLQCNKPFAMHMKFNSIWMKTKTAPFPASCTRLFLPFFFFNSHHQLLTPTSYPFSLSETFRFSFNRKTRVLDKNHEVPKWFDYRSRRICKMATKNHKEGESRKKKL